MQDQPQKSRLERRLLTVALVLVAATGPSLAKPPSKEKSVTAAPLPSLTMHLLAFNAFPELQRDPGVFGVQASLLRPGADARVPAPKDTPAVLLVGYTLLASTVPLGTVYRLEATGPGPDGKPRHLQWALVQPPPTMDNVDFVRPNPNLKMDPGQLDSAVFWVDLGGPLRSRQILPGDTLTVVLGEARHSLAVPKAR